MDKIKILKLSKEGLESSIAGLTQLKPILQKQCLAANLDGQGKQDAKELGEHFETAINAMVTVLAYMEDNEQNEKLQEIIDFFELREGYDKYEVISDKIAEIKDLKGYAADEIGLEWDGEELMVLEEFANEFYEKIIEGVCNVIKSFKEK